MPQDRKPNDYAEAGIEPTVAELMADPLVQMIFARDRIRPEDAWAAISAARRRLAVRRWRSAPIPSAHDTATQDAA